MFLCLHWTDEGLVDSPGRTSGSLHVTCLGEVVLELLAEGVHVIAVEIGESSLYDLPVPHLETIHRTTLIQQCGMIRLIPLMESCAMQ